MQIKPVAEVLAPEGLAAPTLNALVPNESNYTVLLMQPHGETDASAAGVRNRDRDVAKNQFGRLLDGARKTLADLVITPEYSCPGKFSLRRSKKVLFLQKGNSGRWGARASLIANLKGKAVPRAIRNDDL